MHRCCKSQAKISSRCLSPPGWPSPASRSHRTSRPSRFTVPPRRAPPCDRTSRRRRPTSTMRARAGRWRPTTESCTRLQGGRLPQQVWMAQRQVDCSRSTHRLAGDVDPVRINLVPLPSVCQNRENIVLPGAAIFGSAAAERAQDKHRVLLGQTLNLPRLHPLVFKKRVLCSTGAMQHHNCREGPAAVVGLGNVDAIGLFGAIKVGTIRQVEVRSQILGIEQWRKINGAKRQKNGLKANGRC